MCNSVTKILITSSLLFLWSTNNVCLNSYKQLPIGGFDKGWTLRTSTVGQQTMIIIIHEVNWPNKQQDSKTVPPDPVLAYLLNQKQRKKNKVFCYTTHDSCGDPQQKIIIKNLQTGENIKTDFPKNIWFKEHKILTDCQGDTPLSLYVNKKKPTLPILRIWRAENDSYYPEIKLPKARKYKGDKFDLDIPAAISTFAQYIALVLSNINSPGDHTFFTILYGKDENNNYKIIKRIPSKIPSQPTISEDEKLLLSSYDTNLVGLYDTKTGEYLRAIYISDQCKLHPTVSYIMYEQSLYDLWGSTIKKIANSEDDNIIALTTLLYLLYNYTNNLATLKPFSQGKNTQLVIPETIQGLQGHFFNNEEQIVIVPTVSWNNPTANDLLIYEIKEEENKKENAEEKDAKKVITENIKLIEATVSSDQLENNAEVNNQDQEQNQSEDQNKTEENSSNSWCVVM